jgi:DNA-binding NarL/FixJ family response regulator
MTITRIALFDDNENIRDSIAVLMSTLSGYELVGAFADVNHCVEAVRRCRPDMVLMDIEMPGRSGIDAVRELKKEFPTLQILMQTVFEDEDRVFDSICAGASGYLLKTQINIKLPEFLDEMQHGGSPLSPAIARKVLVRMQQFREQLLPEKPPEYHLGSREKEVLQCLVNGLSYKMIANELGISFETVRSHIKNIYEKLHVASASEAVIKALRQRLL